MFVSSVFSVPPNSLQPNWLCWCTISNSNNQNRCKQSGYMTVTLTYRHTVGWSEGGGGILIPYKATSLFTLQIAKKNSGCICTDTITRHTVVCVCVVVVVFCVWGVFFGVFVCVFCVFLIFNIFFIFLVKSTYFNKVVQLESSSSNPYEITASDLHCTYVMCIHFAHSNSFWLENLGYLKKCLCHHSD